MRLAKKIAAFSAAMAMGAGVLTGASVAAAPPAEAASCTLTIYNWKTYNKSCTNARHWVRTAKATSYAGWAGKGRYSDLGVCIAGVTSRGAQYVV